MRRVSKNRGGYGFRGRWGVSQRTRLTTKPGSTTQNTHRRDLLAAGPTGAELPGQAVAWASSSAKPRVLLGLTGMPGPIVVVNVTFLRYLPLAAAGLSLITSSRAAA